MEKPGSEGTRKDVNKMIRKNQVDLVHLLIKSQKTGDSYDIYSLKSNIKSLINENQNKLTLSKVYYQRCIMKFLQ